MAEGRPSARLGAFSEITKKTGVSVRAMREMSHRLVIFLSGTIKKMLEKARFADSACGVSVLPSRKSGRRTP